MVRVETVSSGLSNAYLLESSDAVYLVDCGTRFSKTRILKQISRAGKKLRLIYLTHAHPDHAGSAAALRMQTSAPIAIHRDDGVALGSGRTRLGLVRGRGNVVSLFFPLLQRLLQPGGVEADVLLNDGDHLGAYGLDGQVIHTPGHTPGSSTLLVTGTHAFVGDLVLTTGRPHVQELFAHDWSLLRQSFLKLRDIAPSYVYPGHGAVPLDSQELQDLQIPSWLEDWAE